jgi:hypothetical protein
MVSECYVISFNIFNMKKKRGDTYYIYVFCLIFYFLFFIFILILNFIK